MLQAKANGYTLKVAQDYDALNPRSDMVGWLGTMVCAHRRYDLGDEQAQNIDNYRSWAAWLIGEVGNPDEDIIVLPLYLLDHSGLTMNTTGFNDPWDSGQVGWIYVTAERVKQEFGVEEIDDELKEKVKDILRKEVEVYDMYLRGDIYGFTLEDPNGEVIESVWGFYGSDWKDNGMIDHVPEEHRRLFDLLK